MRVCGAPETSVCVVIQPMARGRVSIALVSPLLVISLASCGAPLPDRISVSPSASSAASALASEPPYAAASGTLASGQTARASGPFFVRYTEATVADTPDEDRLNAPIFVFVLEGTLVLDGQRLSAGAARFVEVGIHRFHAGTPLARIASVGVLPTLERMAALPRGHRLVFASDDISSQAMPAGQYSDALFMIVLAPGAGVGPHTHAGVELKLLLNGRLEVDSAGSGSRVLAAPAFDLISPNRVMSARNVGSQTARLLVFLANPVGLPVPGAR